MYLNKDAQENQVIINHLNNLCLGHFGSDFLFSSIRMSLNRINIMEITWLIMVVVIGIYQEATDQGHRRLIYQI